MFINFDFIIFLSYFEISIKLLFNFYKQKKTFYPSDFPRSYNLVLIKLYHSCLLILSALFKRLESKFQTGMCYFGSKLFWAIISFTDGFWRFASSSERLIFVLLVILSVPRWLLKQSSILLISVRAPLVPPNDLLLSSLCLALIWYDFFFPPADFLFCNSFLHLI